MRGNGLPKMGWEVIGEATSRVRNVQQSHIDGWDQNNKFVKMSSITVKK